MISPRKKWPRFNEENMDDSHEDLNIARMQSMTHSGYIDVGDGCWRPNVLVTSLRCW